MACVNSDKFSASDLCIFIESIEQITLMEQKKKARLQQYRAQYLADTLRYLDQQYPASSSSTLSSTDDPEDESVLENFEEKEIPEIHYAVKDLIDNRSYDEKSVCYGDEECTNVIQNEYCQIEEGPNDANECENIQRSFGSGIYSMPVDYMASSKISKASSTHNVYEQISPVTRAFEISKGSGESFAEPLDPDSTVILDSFTQPLQVVRKKSFKRTLLGLVCKKYRQRVNPKSSNIWCKSESWIKLTLV